MSKTCDKCGRGTSVKISRSHSHVANKKKQYINLQSKKVNGKRLKLCTSCMRTLAKT